ncbi:MAG: hypothetical protein HC767_07040 [Akkermansiaceae bacterium]|nr:hypothetical protein [Akkermansiaceae bacterium]
MRLALWLLILAAIVLGIWGIWGGGWDETFTFAGSVKWLQESGAFGPGLLEFRFWWEI